MFGKIPLTSRNRLDTGLLIDVPRIPNWEVVVDEILELAEEDDE